MMREKLFAAMAAVIIYLGLIAAILFYFGFHHKNESTHFVVKNRKGIEVSLAGPPHPTPPKAAAKAQKKKRHRPKPRNITASQKKAASRPVKKSSKARKPDAKKLFSRVKVPPKKVEKRVSPGDSGVKKVGSKSLKKRQSERGMENAYLAKVERLLKGWPAQANFAGEEIDIRLRIYPDGHFDYTILSLSGNPDFNHELISYLKQLQGIGFGPHTHGRPYDIEVKFIAHP